MSRSIILLGLVSALAVPAAARTTDRPAKGLASVNVPIVTRADYALDLAAPDGAIAAQEAARLDGWFRSMQLGYGDRVFVDSPLGYIARDDVARIAGQYGMLVSLGAPMTAGPVPQGMVRVVVTRTSASVGCWSTGSGTFSTRTSPGPVTSGASVQPATTTSAPRVPSLALAARK